MSTPSERLRALLIVGLCGALSGCVAHFDPRPTHVRSIPVVLPTLSAEPLYVSFPETAIIDWKLGQQPNPVEQAAILEALRRSGAFAEVHAGIAPPGALRLDIEMMQWDDEITRMTGDLQGSHKRNIANGFASVFTLGVVPYMGKHPMSIKAVLYRTGDLGGRDDYIDGWVMDESVPRAPNGYTTIRPQYTHIVGWPALFHSERRNAEVMASAVVTWVLHGLRDDGVEL